MSVSNYIPTFASSKQTNNININIINHKKNIIMKTIEFALQDNCGNVISTYGTLAELRDELLAVNNIDEVASDEKAYAKTDAIVRDYVGVLEVKKIIDGEPSGTYNHVSDSDEGAITDEEHDAMYDMYEELADIIENLVIKNRAHMIYKTLPSHLEVVKCGRCGYNIAITGFRNADELQDYVNEHDHMLAGAIEGDKIIDKANSNYEYRRGIDMLKTWRECDEVEVYEPMSREEFLAEVVEPQLSNEDDNKFVTSYYSDALSKIGQVGNDEILTIYTNGGEAYIEPRYVMDYEYDGHTISLCAYASSLDF